MHTQFDHEGEMPVALHAYLSQMQRTAIGYALSKETDRKVEQHL